MRQMRGEVGKMEMKGKYFNFLPGCLLPDQGPLYCTKDHGIGECDNCLRRQKVDKEKE